MPVVDMADLNTLLTAHYVKIDDYLGDRSKRLIMRLGTLGDRRAGMIRGIGCPWS